MFGCLESQRLTSHAATHPKMTHDPPVGQTGCALNKMSLFRGICFFLIAVLPAVAQAQQGRYALIVAGVSGEPEFKEKFWNWSNQMYQVLSRELKFPKQNIFLLTEDPNQGSSVVTAKSTREEVSKVFERLKANVRPDDLVFILLLGHGSFDGKEYKFNLVGPDITGSELKAFLDRFSNQRVVLVCTTSCSGILTRTLSQKNRVIITATKNEFENNQTAFASFFIEAFQNKAADSDKNGRVSFLEAYLYTAQKVDSWYKGRKLLATEHPLLEDNGDGVGASLPAPANGEGLFASRIFLGEMAEAVALAAADSPTGSELSSLYSHRQKLEETLQELKYKKSSLSETEYNKRLEGLLIELAQTNQKIKNLAKK